MSTGTPAPAVPRYSERSQIPPQHTWDLSDLFASDTEFEAALKSARELPERYAAQRCTACSSAQGLLDYLVFDDKSGMALARLANYAERRYDEDTRAARYQDYTSQVTSLMVQVESAGAWFTPELLNLDAQTLEDWFAQEPGLEAYRRLIEQITRMRPHTLPSEQEELLAQAGEMAAAPERSFSMLNDADLTFPEAQDSQGGSHPVTHGTFIPLMMSADRTLRQNAFTGFYGVYQQFANTSAAILSSQVKSLKFFAEARSYQDAPGAPASLEASLFPTEVPSRCYLNLIDSVHRNMDAMYRYVDLRKRLLGLDSLHYWDIYAPLLPSEEMHFSYGEACDIMLQALEPLGSQYTDLVRKGLDERWIDVYETPGKRAGAYSAGGYGMHPVILLNYQGTLNDVFTLVHEMGHSIHTYLSTHTQPPAYSDYVMFVAEVASTLNECLLINWFLEHAGDGLDSATAQRRRAYLVNYYLEQFRTTLYRQCMFAEFERDVAQIAADGKGLTADTLCQRYAQLCSSYFGPSIEADPGISYEWARIPHFYYDYYVYVYATSFAAAVALSRRILEEGESAVADYLAFLSGGSSQPPLDLLRGAGVDMNTPGPIDQALAVFAGLVDEMDQLTRE